MTVFKTKLIKVNKFTRPGYRLHSVKAILIHWTANPGASAENHFNYFNNGAGGRYASAQAFIDSKDTLLIIPENEVAYAANETGRSKIAKLNGNYGYTNGNANGCTISVEMCVEKNGTISKTVEAKTVKAVAELCKRHKLTEKDVYRHYDVTGKSCPTPFLNASRFNAFKAAVKKELGGGSVTVPVPEKPNTKPTYFTSVPASKTIRCITNVGIYNSVEFTDANKLKAHYEPGDTVVIASISKSKAGTPRFKTLDGKYITANKAYVQSFTPPTTGSKPTGQIKVLVNDLNYYDSPRWNRPTGTVKKNTVLNVVGKVKVDGVDQYKTISGTYITASPKFVKEIKSGSSGSSSVDLSQYYTTNPGRVISKKTVNLYKSAEFNKNTEAGMSYKAGTPFTIEKVVKSKAGTPRLYTKSGFYLTANKGLVRKG